jgi:hypothetical protein
MLPMGTNDLDAAAQRRRQGRIERRESGDFGIAVRRCRKLRGISVRMAHIFGRLAHCRNLGAANGEEKTFGRQAHRSLNGDGRA